MANDTSNAREAHWIAWLVARESVVSFGANRGLETAATLAYYGFLSLMPFLLVCVFVLGTVLRSSDAVLSGMQSVMSDLFPSFNQAILFDLITLANTKVWGVVSIVVLVWSMTPFAGAMRNAVYRVFKTDRRLPFIKAKLIDITAILGLMTLFVALTSWRVFNSVRSEAAAEPSTLSRLLGLSVPFAATLLVMSAFYAWFSPRRPRWTHLLAGAFTATLLLSIVRPLFGLLLHFNPNYGYAFGSLKAIFLLIVWAYYTFAVLLFGAEVMANAARKDALLLRGLFLGLPIPKKGSWRLVERFVRSIEKEEVLFREGEEGREMFYVQSGAVELRKNGRLLKVMKAGDYFGELSMLLDTPRTADAVGAEPATSLIAISQDNLDTLLRENPAIVRNILKEMALRLKNTSDLLNARDAEDVTRTSRP